MEFYQIRYFLALCRDLNFTRAAEACNVSQPALTAAIRKLEERLGGALFVREGGRVAMTALGQSMRAHLSRIEETRRAAEQEAADILSAGARRIELGVMCTVGPATLGPALARFQEAAPGVEIVLHDVWSGRAEELLLSGAIDAAILGRSTPLPPRFEWIELTTERMVLAVGDGHPLASRPGLRLADLDGVRWVDRLRCEFREKLGARLAAESISLDTVQRSEREDWLLAVVARGEAVAIYPSGSVAMEGVTARTLEDVDERRTVVLAWVRDRERPPALRQLIGHFSEA